MARRTKSITLSEDNRDKGKVFLLTEMPAHKAEKWACRALLALIKSGVQIPDEMAQAGMAGVAAMGSSFLTSMGGVKWAELEPLLDEMMTCMQTIPSPGIIRPLCVIDGAEDIEEVKTLITLRKEVLELHLGFSLAERLATSATKVQGVPTT
jgi:hypothetical protein